MPNVVVLAGPNGAGKSTSAPALLRGAFQVAEFVNADVIAQGLSGFQANKAAMRAGRIMLERLDELAAEHADFAFETTLASKSFAPRIVKLRRQGYSFHLYFLWLESPELALTRVAERVASGGHDVPEFDVRRRYDAGLRNLVHLYLPLTTSWITYDNSSSGSPRPIAAGRGVETLELFDPIVWEGILSRARSLSP